jgi:hypothetical protein
MSTSPGLSTSNNWDWAETLKNNFTLLELDSLHKIGLSSVSVIRVTIHSKQEVNDNTLKKHEYYSSRKVSITAQNSLQVDHEGKSWENGEKLDLA